MSYILCSKAWDLISTVSRRKVSLKASISMEVMIFPYQSSSLTSKMSWIVTSRSFLRSIDRTTRLSLKLLVTLMLSAWLIPWTCPPQKPRRSSCRTRSLVSKRKRSVYRRDLQTCSWSITTQSSHASNSNVLMVDWSVKTKVCTRKFHR